MRVRAMSDGDFLAAPGYFSPDARVAEHLELFTAAGRADLPIGCFLIGTGDGLVLVDAGLGPVDEPVAGGSALRGGRLLSELRDAGVELDRITDVVCTHLHTDHVGWLFDADARPRFPAATIHLGRGDWDHFVTGPGEMHEHVRAGFTANTGRLADVDRPQVVRPEITALPAPGHTPGHLVVTVEQDGRILVLLGDAATCAKQLDEPTWHSIGDVDPDLAAATRDAWWERLARPRTTGVGAHFQQLRAGRVVVDGPGRRWSPEEA